MGTTLNEGVQSQSVFLNDWADADYAGRRGLAALASDFDLDAAALKGVEILLADYTYENYSGSAFVLFRRDGKLYEVHGGHCSCYGLEGQWEPEETTVKALEKALGSEYSHSGHRDELAAIVASLATARTSPE